MLVTAQINSADQTMDHSFSNIQLTPEAKRIIEGEIAYQTSGQGFWIGVSFYGFLIFVSSLLLLAAIGFCLYVALRGNLWGLAWAILPGSFLIIPILLFGNVRRAIKSRRG
jgi:hypothetical protein